MDSKAGMFNESVILCYYFEASQNATFPLYNAKFYDEVKSQDYSSKLKGFKGTSITI